MPDSIPAHVYRFLREQIRSIAQLELLLLVHGKPEASWTPEEVAKALYIPGTFAEALLESLHEFGLVSVEESAGRRYRFKPKSAELRHLVDDLAQVYRERPVTAINVIYSAPIDNLQSFADAFRFRKKEPE